MVKSKKKIRVSGGRKRKGRRKRFKKGFRTLKEKKQREEEVRRNAIESKEDPVQAVKEWNDKLDEEYKTITKYKADEQFWWDKLHKNSPITVIIKGKFVDGIVSNLGEGYDPLPNKDVDITYSDGTTISYYRAELYHHIVEAEKAKQNLEAGVISEADMRQEYFRKLFDSGAFRSGRAFGGRRTKRRKKSRKSKGGTANFCKMFSDPESRKSLIKYAKSWAKKGKFQPVVGKRTGKIWWTVSAKKFANEYCKEFLNNNNAYCSTSGNCSIPEEEKYNNPTSGGKKKRRTRRKRKRRITKRRK